ncbi:E3 ubiquitin-protein ligase TRIM71 [Geodia barretti]|uniref:E3 ubiquitin-protein ligase TRIM71 n=1 Tax=Geodia barretti TaxID=519541 RepID=A0AA35WP40_GEOBA|nr:E3 ubiquitin-protein ligase TRIM71 [Geodia barretti]
MTREKLKNVAAQQDQLELVATRLKSCCGFLQESLRTGSQVEILAMAKPFVQQVQDVTSSFKPESLEPEEQANLEFNCSQNELLQMCQQYGQVIANTVCHAKGDGLKLAVVGERTTATVEVVNWKGRKYSRPVKVSCELVSSDGSRRVRGEAKKVRDGEYEISYLPQHRGPHYLHIRVGDKHISGSPFPLSVITTTPTNIITGVKDPWGLALDNKGQLVVVETDGHCVSIFGDSGEKVRSFGGQGLWSRSADTAMWCSALCNWRYLVADQLNNRIQVFSPDGKSVKCIGTKGSGPLQFDQPVGIAVHPQSKKIYVTDTANDRVQILNEDLTFSQDVWLQRLRQMGSSKGYLESILTAGAMYTCLIQTIAEFKCSVQVENIFGSFEKEGMVRESLKNRKE